MKENLTEVVFILDRSGSMSGLVSDTIGGYNSLMEKQKKEEGECIVSTVLFSDRSKVLYNRVNIKDIPVMTEKDYVTCGCTALLDAVGSAVQHISSVHLELEEKDIPSKTLFVITTDGLENASREYSYATVKNIIENKRKEGWEFMFLGANIDAAEESARFGIRADMAVNYNCDAKGIKTNFNSIDMAMHMLRNEIKLDSSWKEEIEKDYKGRNRK